MPSTENQSPETIVKKADIKRALVEAGIVSGDILLVHSSFKSMGTIEGGADTVISAMLEVLGEEGTLLFPTLCQKDWENVYRNWNVNTSPSDVGYLTNYFRLLPGALRSDQATHSVAAIGKHAAYITADHGKSGRRYGTFGDTPFAVDSPWEKIYSLKGKILFLGVSLRKNTLRHLVEYRFVNRYLLSLVGDPSYEELKKEVRYYKNGLPPSAWPYINDEAIFPALTEHGLLKHSACGNAEFDVLSAFDYVNLLDEALEADPGKWISEEFASWVERVRKTGQNRYRDFVYEAMLRRRFAEALPPRVYDAHFHINLRPHASPIPEEERFLLSTENVVGARLVGGLMMDSPSPAISEDFEGFTHAGIEKARAHGWDFGMVLPPEVGYDRAAAMLDACPEIKCLKPYFCFTEKGLHADISDFCPEWIFRLAHDRGLPILLHLAHYDLQLDHPKNIEEIVCFCEKHPNAKLILAHCALGHNYDRLHEALPKIAHLKNIWFDCSGVSEPLSIYYCIKTFGPERMMWGGDYNFGDTLGRLISQGGNFYGIHPNLTPPPALPRDYIYVALSNAYEGMLALLHAKELASLSDDEWQGIMADNARTLFKSVSRKISGGTI